MVEQLIIETGQVIVIIKDLLFHLKYMYNYQLVLKQWKGALNRIMSLSLGLLKNNNLTLRLGRELWHYPSFKPLRSFICVMQSTFSNLDGYHLVAAITVRLREVSSL